MRAVYEVLRVHSSVFSLRIVKETVELPSSSGASVVVPSGSTLLVANMSGHDDARCFDDPDEFRPNRFVQPDGSFATSAFLRVWGGGPGQVRRADVATLTSSARAKSSRSSTRFVLCSILADDWQFWLIVRVLETLDVRFVGLEKTAGTKIVDSTGATVALPQEEPGRGGSGTTTPAEGFTIELRMRAD